MYRLFYTPRKETGGLLSILQGNFQDADLVLWIPNLSQDEKLTLSHAILSPHNLSNSIFNITCYLDNRDLVYAWSRISLSLPLIRRLLYLPLAP